MPERPGEVHLEKKIVFHVSTPKEEIVVTVKNVIFGIFPHCKYSEKDKYQMRKDCPFIHLQKKNPSTSLQRKSQGKRKRVQERKGNRGNREYCKSQIQEIRNFQEHFKANGTFSKWDKPKCP